MHPFLTADMARTHIDDLHRDAEQHRLAAQARAGRTHAVLAGWREAVASATARARRAVAPATPQPVCCPA
jgi:hypothetical protein